MVRHVNPKKGADIAAGAGAGAATGSAFGPIGTAVGAGLGAITQLFGGGRRRGGDAAPTSSAEMARIEAEMHEESERGLTERHEEEMRARTQRNAIFGIISAAALASITIIAVARAGAGGAAAPAARRGDAARPAGPAGRGAAPKKPLTKAQKKKQTRKRAVQVGGAGVGALVLLALLGVVRKRQQKQRILARCDASNLAHGGHTLQQPDLPLMCPEKDCGWIRHADRETGPMQWDSVNNQWVERREPARKVVIADADGCRIDWAQDVVARQQAWDRFWGYPEGHSSRVGFASRNVVSGYDPRGRFWKDVDILWADANGIKPAKRWCREGSAEQALQGEQLVDACWRYRRGDLVSVEEWERRHVEEANLPKSTIMFIPENADLTGAVVPVRISGKLVTPTIIGGLRRFEVLPGIHSVDIRTNDGRNWRGNIEVPFNSTVGVRVYLGRNPATRERDPGSIYVMPMEPRQKRPVSNYRELLG